MAKPSNKKISPLDEGVSDRAGALEAERGAHMAKASITIKLKMANAVDATVGARIKNLRLRNKLSQTRLGELISVTNQQIHKYETGTNRVGAGHLARFAKFFGVSVSAFYSEARGSNATQTPHDTDRIVRAFEALKDNDQKVALIRLTEKLGRYQQGLSDEN